VNIFGEDKEGERKKNKTRLNSSEQKGKRLHHTSHHSLIPSFKTTIINFLYFFSSIKLAIIIIIMLSFMLETF